MGSGEMTIQEMIEYFDSSVVLSKPEVNVHFIVNCESTQCKLRKQFVKYIGRVVKYIINIK